MSGRLFQKDLIPTTKISAKIAPKIQREIIGKILEKYPDIEYLTLGSVGKKRDDDFNGDIDIGIKANSIDELSDIIHNVFDYTQTVDNKTIYIISVKYPYEIDNVVSYVAVDFILIENIEYTKFRYYCPDYRVNESKYKVGTKIMFMGIILNHCKQQSISNIRTKYLYLPTGLYLEYWNKDTKEVKEELVTLNPQEVVDIMFNDCDPSICNTIESLWDGIHSDKFKYPNEVANIEMSFFVNSYRKGWEEQVKPQDFNIQHWDLETINKELEKHTLLRQINMMLCNMKVE